MKAKVLFDYESRTCGYYRLIVKESAMSYIVFELTNQSRGYDKEIRYKKSERMAKDVARLVSSNEENVQQEVSQFRYYYAESRDNGSYWQSWRKIF